MLPRTMCYPHLFIKNSMNLFIRHVRLSRNRIGQSYCLLSMYNLTSGDEEKASGETGIKKKRDQVEWTLS